MRPVLTKVVINAVAIWIATLVIPQVTVEGSTVGETVLSLVIVGALFGLINTFIRPLLILLTLPATLLTLGLFIFVINGLLFWFVGSFIQGFHVAGFWSAVFGAILYSIISWALSALLLGHRDRADV